MYKRIISIIALFVSFSVLCLGHGLQSVLLPARATLLHYSDFTTGMLMSAYYAGFLGGTFVCPWLIARVGHIRVFAASAAGAAAIMLGHALFVQPVIWIMLRILYGLCLVHLYTVMESWLNSIGDKETRGKVLSVYMIVNFVSMSMGQLLFFIAPAGGFELFSISGIMLSLSVLPLILSRIIQPAEIRAPESFGVRELYRISPLGITGALIAGLMGGAYWGLTAAYILEIGFPQDDVAWFMAASLIGGLLAQWPLGVFSDRINRRYAILLALALVFVASLMLAMMALWRVPEATFGPVWLIAWGIVFGAGFHPFYSLCMAHVNDFVSSEYFVRASAGLQFIQSSGALVGPLIAGWLMRMLGNKMLFVYIALMAGIFVTYTLQRLIRNRIPALSRPFRWFMRNGIIPLAHTR